MKRGIKAAPVLNAGRGELNLVRSIAKRKGFQDQDVRPIVLRMYQQLVATKSSYVFDCSVATAQHPLEIRIDKSDLVVGSRMALGVHKVLLDANGDEQPANSPISFYPDPDWFDGAGGGTGLPGSSANEAQSLETLYNGHLSLKTDQDIRLQEYDAADFRMVPETQFNPTADTGHLFGRSGNEFRPLYSMFYLAGNRNNKFELQLGNGDYSAIAGVAADHVNYAVVMVKGFILVRGAESFTKGDFSQIF